MEETAKMLAKALEDLLKKTKGEDVASDFDALLRLEHALALYKKAREKGAGLS